MSAFCKRCNLHVPDGVPACMMCGSAVLAPAPFIDTISSTLSPPLRAQGQPRVPKLIAGVAVSLIVAPIFRLISIVSIQIPALFGERYQFYLERYPGLAGLLYFELAMNLILIGSALVLNVLFYTKNRRFPVYMIAYASATFLYLLAVTGAVRTVFSECESHNQFCAACALDDMGSGVDSVSAVFA
jgi:hypothetical protein